MVADVCAAGLGMPCFGSVSLAHRRHPSAEFEVAVVAADDVWGRAKGSSFCWSARCCCGWYRAAARRRTSAGIEYV